MGQQSSIAMNKVAIAKWSTLPDRVPTYALVANVDLVVVRYGDEVSVLFGRCLHRGALLARRFRRRRQPDLRGARLGLPHPHRRQRVQQS